MIAHDDILLGQLAIARGFVTLAQLLSSVEKAGATGRALRDILITNGYLSNSDIKQLEDRLSEDDSDVFEELQQGQTIVIAQLNESVALSETFDEAPPGFSLDVDLQARGATRYERLKELGRGGMGEVFEAKDTVMMRNVAVKKLLEHNQDEKSRHRLLLEAQVTGLLEHPSIVPVYDLLADEDGAPYYTMRVVQEKSLAQIIDGIEKEPVALTHLVSILRQVSLAIHFAHDLGVVHRDLKPENILVGKYGEVYVIDWGIAKILNTEIGLETTDRSSGSLVGTPQYMAPEQARGDNEAVDPRSDIYALGAILYEILTLQPMYQADHILGLLFMVVHDEPVPPAEKTDRIVPPFLQEVCLRAVKKNPRDRFQTANQFADQLELFLDGVKEAERQAELANDAFEQAHQVRAIYYEVRDQHHAMQRELETLREAPDKNALWDAEQAVEDLKVEIERRFTDTIRQYSQTLVHDPDHPDAREAIAGLYWERFRDAEISGDRALAAYFEGLVRQYNDGRYDALLEGNASLTFSQDVLDSAELTLFRFQSVQRRLVEWEVAQVSSATVNVTRGSYSIHIESSEYADLAVPVLIDRGEHLDVEIPLIEANRVPNDFVVVPGGRFVSKPSVDGNPSVSSTIETFAIQKTPVTVREYLEFLNALSEEDAIERLPKLENITYFERGADGVFRLQSEDPEGDPWDLDWPMCIVNFYDAQAYAAWRSKRDGFRFRLPSILEWQKAARGVDGRTYPWGNAFDPSFCHMRDSVPGRALPTKVASYETDCSPYGAYDMCANMAEWTVTQQEGPDDVRFLGGASFNSLAEMCRLDFTWTSPPQYKFGHYGFRLALELD